MMKLTFLKLIVCLFIILIMLAGAICLFPKDANAAECSASTTCGSTCTHGDLTYGTVLGADGKCWLDRNLGATQVATAYNDSASYGWIFQWGRGADGHQIPTSGKTSTISSSDTPGHANFITKPSYFPMPGPYDWREPQNDNLWQGINGINNPCPTGFRLPTQLEWITLVSSAGITNSATAFNSSLKLTAAGYRGPTSATYEGQGSVGYYWSSSPVGEGASQLKFDSSSVSPANVYLRNTGFSVRCLADTTAECSASTVCGSPCSYGGVTYNTVPIGTQCWFKENLNVGTMLVNLETPDNTAPTLNDPSTVSKWCFYDSSTYCASEGGLYTWAETNALPNSCNSTYCSVPTPNQGICPTGWHVPTDSEQYTLENYLTTPGQTCDATRNGWDCSDAGTKLIFSGSSGFDALGAGNHETVGDGSFFDKREPSVHFWSSSEQPVIPSYAWHRTLVSLVGGGDVKVFRGSYLKVFGYSVRCLADTTNVVEVSPISHDFDSVTVGTSSAPQTFTISNTGTADLHVSDINLSDTTNYSLDVNGGSNPCGSTTPTITPNGNCTVTATFNPLSVGQKDANLTISSDDPYTPTLDVTLTGTGVLLPILVDIDIKPATCSNKFKLPKNVSELMGKLPVAILGTESFDVTTIVPASIRMTKEGVEGEVAPVRYGYEDVATPYEGELCDCHDLNGDGYMDLILKFKRKHLAKELDLYNVAGQTIPLTITGNLYDSTPIRGQDCVKVKIKRY